MSRKMPGVAFAMVLGLAACCPARGVEVVPPRLKLKTDRPRVLLRPKATPYAVSLAQLGAIKRDADFDYILARLRRQRSSAAQAMAYLLTGDRSAADRAIDRMRKYHNPEGKGDAFTVYFRLREFALAYDWLHSYPGFTKEMKAEVRANMAPLAATGMKISNDHLFHNYVWVSAGGVGLWALATAGEDAAADDLYDRIRKRLNERLYPAWKYLDGLPSEPMWYWALYVYSPGVLALLGAQSATETDVMGVIKKDGDWLDRHYEYLIHVTTPSMEYLPWGDHKGGGPDGGVTHEMAGVSDALAWALKSPHGAWFSRWMAKSKRGLKRFYGETTIFYMLYTRHLTTKPAVPALSLLAGGKHGGHLVARSDWGPDATVVGFGCNDHFGAHNHYDQGGFIIYRRGLLAVDPPVYRKVRGPQQKSEYHNTLLIGGQGQRAVHGQWFKTVEEFKQNLTGGRRLETGDILFYREAGRWVAVAGQYAQAYPTGLLESCVRQLLFVRPGAVVIVDQIAPAKGKDLPEVQWLLHVPRQPEIQQGDVLTDNGASRLRCRPLFPGPSIPKVEPTPVKTHRVGYTYKRAAGLSLVHLLEVGGPKVAKPAGAQVRRTARGIEVALNGRRYLFANRGKYEVTEEN